MCRSEKEIRKLCPDAMVLQGVPIRGSSVKEAEKDIADWLKHFKST